MFQRHTTRSGVSVPEHQHSSDVSPAKTEIVITPSTNAAVFGASFLCDYKEKGVLLHDLCLQFNMSAISTMTSGMFVPAHFLIDHVDYMQSGNIIDSYYPLDQFLQSQLFDRDEDRAIINVAAGHYASTAQRTALAAGNASYYLSLRDYFKQGKGIPILENCHELQLRVFLRPLADVTAGTGTAVATINSVNLLSRVTRLRDGEVAQMRKSLASAKALTYRFNDLKQQSYTVNSGVSSTNIVLSAITGPVSYLMFVVRPVASLAGNSAFSFTAITSYELLNSSGQNFVGGQAISNSQALLIVGNKCSKSSYLSETALGITNNGANVYIYSFSADTADSAENAVSMGTHNFTGTEQLRINFTGSLGAAVQVDVLAYTEAVLAVGTHSVKKAVYRH